MNQWLKGAVAVAVQDLHQSSSSISEADREVLEAVAVADHHGHQLRDDAWCGVAGDLME